jgi:beta-aspartyl-peptidase (threonine type)
MKKIYLLLLMLMTQLTFSQHYALVLHGGAGNITPQRLSLEEQKEYHEKMREALQEGEKVLKEGGSALSAVTIVIQMLEESPLFNAGKGAVFTWEETNELDASVMDGRNLNAGAVTGISKIKSPILAAVEVMTNSPHVMLSGKGAEEFAKGQGLDTVDNAYFKTQKRLKSLKKFKKKTGSLSDKNQDWKFGTVGCVALDREGNIAAGTSTGGMTGKRYGRIGDSPIIGAGTYADNSTCGVSGTGHGEFFIRYNVAYDISALMKYAKLSLKAAAEEVVLKKLVVAKGSGGIIALDRAGNISMVFNTSGMFRGYVKEGEEIKTAMFKEE